MARKSFILIMTVMVALIVAPSLALCQGNDEDTPNDNSGQSVGTPPANDHNPGTPAVSQTVNCNCGGQAQHGNWPRLEFGTRQQTRNQLRISGQVGRLNGRVNKLDHRISTVEQAVNNSKTGLKAQNGRLGTVEGIVKDPDIGNAALATKTDRLKAQIEGGEVDGQQTDGLNSIVAGLEKGKKGIEKSLHDLKETVGTHNTWLWLLTLAVLGIILYLIFDRRGPCEVQPVVVAPSQPAPVQLTTVQPVVAAAPVAAQPVVAAPAQPAPAAPAQPAAAAAKTNDELIRLALIVKAANNEVAKATAEMSAATDKTAANAHLEETQKAYRAAKAELDEFCQKNKVSATDLKSALDKVQF